MGNKILLVEKWKGEEIEYYTNEFTDVKSLVKEIIYNRLDAFFSDEDQTGPELLKMEDIDGYIDHTLMCYCYTGDICEALNNLKEFVNDFLNCEKEELQHYITLFNEKVLDVAGINVLYEVYTNYENEFKSEDDRARFDALLNSLVNSDPIRDYTYLLWDYQNNYYIGGGEWRWSNSIENMKLFFKHMVLRFMLDVSDVHLKIDEDTENYGVNKLINSLIMVGDEEQRKILLNINELMKELDENITFDTFQSIVDKISINFKKLNVSHELYLFKGTYYAKMLLKEHKSEFDESNLIKTFTEDFMC